MPPKRPAPTKQRGYPAPKRPVQVDSMKKAQKDAAHSCSRNDQISDEEQIEMPDEGQSQDEHEWSHRQKGLSGTETKEPKPTKRQMVLFRHIERNWDEAVQREKARLESELPIITKAMYEASDKPGCPSPTYDVTWYQQDEELLVQRYWTATPLESGISDLVSGNTALNELFRLSLRIFGVDPITLFTMGTDDFEFGSDTTSTITINGRDHLTPVWSELFCTNLAKIMTHPMWCHSDQWSFMLFAIKWAVICRTDDRRPLSHVDKTLLIRAKCPLVDGQTIKSHRYLHEQQQQILWERDALPPQQAELLSTISEHTVTRMGAVSARNYIIVSSDLTAVIEGLDNLPCSGLMDCELFLQLFTDAGGHNEYPTKDELPDLYKNCYLHMERRRCKAFKLQPRVPSEPPKKIVN